MELGRIPRDIGWTRAGSSCGAVGMMAPLPHARDLRMMRDGVEGWKERLFGGISGLEIEDWRLIIGRVYRKAAEVAKGRKVFGGGRETKRGDAEGAERGAEGDERGLVVAATSKSAGVL